MYGPGSAFNALNSNAVSSVKTGPRTTSAALEHLSRAISSMLPWISGVSIAVDCSVTTVPRMARTSDNLWALPVMKFRVVGRDIVDE